MNKSDLDFVNNVAKLKNRVAVKDYYFKDLPQEIRSLSFTVSNLETLRMVQLAQRSLENAMNQGLSFQEWKEVLDPDLIKSLYDSRLETVYRTNVASVYAQSTRYNAATSKVTEYLVFSAVGDERTRKSHLALDGVCKRADSTFWDKYTPPLAYSCRCSVIAIDKEEAKEIGISRASNDSFKIDDGFGKSKLGDISSQVSKETEREISRMPNSALKKSFQRAQENIRGLVDIWWEQEKTNFEP